MSGFVIRLPLLHLLFHQKRDLKELTLLQKTSTFYEKLAFATMKNKTLKCVTGHSLLTVRYNVHQKSHESFLFIRAIDCSHFQWTYSCKQVKQNTVSTITTADTNGCIKVPKKGSIIKNKDEYQNKKYDWWHTSWSRHSNLQTLSPRSLISFHHLKPTRIRPLTFFTTQKSRAARSTVTTKMMTKLFTNRAERM